MATFALGVSTLILALALALALTLAYGAKSAIKKRQNLLRALADCAKPVMGATFIAVGLALWLGLHQGIDRWLIENLPVWLIRLSVSI